MKTKDLLIALIALVVGIALGWLIATQQAADVEVPDELITGAVVAAGSTDNRASVAIPSHAVQISPGLFDLGTRRAEGKTVQGYMIIDFKKGYHHRPEHERGGSPGSGGEEKSKCFSFLARNAKWKTVENYIVDPTNSSGLVEQEVRDNLALDIAKWEVHAGNIFGNEVSGIVDGVDLIRPDNKNEVYFGNIDSPNAIAVTVVWGIFSGPPSGRELVEWDQVYDHVDFDWSLSESGVAGKMDFENLATHELGHSFGLGDLYTNSCSEETMYGYASYGETKKRDLNSGDIAGITGLYK